VKRHEGDSQNLTVGDTLATSRTRTPTQAQRANGAQAVAYRAEQLTLAVVLLRNSSAIQSPYPWGRAVIHNSLVESALIGARGLAEFFFDKRNVNPSTFLAGWQDPVAKVAPQIVRPISQYLAHVTKGSKEGERHPGAWPVTELAVTLVGAAARFVRALEANGPTTSMTEWFKPSPVSTYQVLTTVLAPYRTVPSDNPTVAHLTRTLQAYLEAADDGHPG
jgi:hypothetical protein